MKHGLQQFHRLIISLVMDEYLCRLLGGMCELSPSLRFRLCLPSADPLKPLPPAARQCLWSTFALGHR